MNTNNNDELMRVDATMKADVLLADYIMQELMMRQEKELRFTFYISVFVVMLVSQYQIKKDKDGLREAHDWLMGAFDALNSSIRESTQATIAYNEFNERNKNADS